MFKRSGTNNNDNDYAGTSGSGNNFNVSEVIDDTDHKSDREVEKYMPPHRRESRKNYSPPRQRNYSPPRQRNYSSPRQRNYSQPRQRDYSSPRQRNYLQPTQRNYSPPPRQGNYLSPRQRDYSPPRQRNYLQPTQRNYPPQSPRQGNIFSFSELTHKGSDKIIFITNGEEIKNSAWKRVLRKKNPLNQNDVRIFVSSALSATDSQVDYGAEELVTELGNPDGLKKLREIINFRSMSCDAGLDKRVLSFQYVVLPLLGVLTRTTITECTLENYVHAIFMVVYTNLDSFLYDGVMKMLETLVQRNSLVDNCISVEDLLSEEPYSFIPTSLGIFFLVIVRLLTELLYRVKEATINETMCNIARDLQRLKVDYQQSIEQQPSPTSTDPLINNLETRKLFFEILEKEMNIMNKMLPIIEKTSKRLNSKLQLREKAIANVFYDPPGELSNNGRRHDNDFERISEISIIPTKEEVMCDRQPFLPSSLPNAPHFLPDGMERLFDTQFRLLREDMLNVIRSGISNFITALINDWSSSNKNRELKNIQEKGGRFRYDNTSDLQVYTGIQFVDIVCNRRKGFSCTLRFTPLNVRSARNLEGRIEYWRKCKKLQVGSLVTLLLPNRDIIQAQSNNFVNGNVNNSDLYSLYFGVVVTRKEEDLADYDHATIGINFIDSSIYPIALDEILNRDKITKKSLEKRFMLESTGVYLETYIHTLKTLQSANPSLLPFEKYLAPDLDDLNRESEIEVDNPFYTRAPEFQFDLSVLCKNKEQSLKLNVADASTHDEVAINVANYSKLDETQAKALIFALTREIALIEGPPGTGKTVVGVEIMKVLLAKENRRTQIGPILTICFTNHALDQFLEHLLDENIKNIVRLGARTKSERIKDFNLEVLSKNHAHNNKMSYLIAKLHSELESIEDAVNDMTIRRWMKWDDIREYLMIEENSFYKKFTRVTSSDLPSWVLGTNVQELCDDEILCDSEEKSWSNHQDRRKKNLSIFEKWTKCEDINTINKRKEVLLNIQNNKKDNKDDKKVVSKNTFEFLKYYEESDDELQIDYTTQWIEDYNEPKSDRPLSVLLNDYSIWQMSISERHRLHDYWRVKVHNEFVEKSSKLQKRHEKKRKELNNIYDIESRQILLESDVIGVTTNGAAKYQDLIRSIDPKIIICEEAGEVLEAHILSALTPSTQHLILIGDHNQLRPHISTFSLGMDSKTGRNYQLDKSLFERLVNGDRASKVEKSQLLTQRRMRKGEISDLIRYTLYPNLIDGENTAKYPNVCGAQHNVYFIDHRHPEDNSDSDLAIQSHVNTYEVKMVVEMVKYFVRNGYTKPEDIAVLTPYLGQMMKIKEALAKSFVVVIDERDAQNIIEMEEEQKENESNKKGKDSIVKNTNVATTKSLNHQVTLRTVDNFQGEEANIVIVSLVRNVSKSGDYDSIGFLKSSNRSNVLLSRAREGMYLIGNSEMMATKSEDVWAPVINMLKTRNPPQIGFGMPIVCNQHPDYKNIITESEQFERFSPDGGCYKKCQFMLNCGHACTYKCHSDDPKHIGIKCFQPCRKLQPDCSHPCPKQCFETCGRCNHLIGKVKLPCNHEIQNGRCWQNQDKETLYCKELVTKKLLNCEHYKEIRCSKSVKNVECREKCKELLKCGHECLNECSECQKYSILPENSKNENKVENIKEFKRNQHGKCKHICERLLFCGHICKQYCHEGNDCPPCENKCTVSCEHAACNKNCAEPCVVCAEKCLWKCKHQGKCELSCGAPCYRLPCNKRCDKKFECGHRCAGICGETCPSNDFCVNCASEKVKDQVPDVIMGTKFSEIDWNEERMVVLSCGHVYTMETMDMLVKMEEYYEGSIERGWTSIKALPTSSKDIIKCPACRAPVKNIRSHELNEITKQVIIHEEEMRNGRTQLINELYYSRLKEVVMFENHNTKSSEVSEVTPYDYFGNIEKYHGFSKAINGVWVNHVENLLSCYQKLTSIIRNTKMPPYKKAFEAAVSSLYQAKSSGLSSFASTSLGSSISESQLTFQETFSQMGISIPRIDQKIYLDVFFEIINIQKILYHEVLFIIENAKYAKSHLFAISKNKECKKLWKIFAENLQYSTQEHLYTIKQTAESSHHTRHCLLANVELLELYTNMLKLQLKCPPNGIVDKKLQTDTIEKCEDTKRDVVNMIEYCIGNEIEKEFKDYILNKRLSDLQKKCDEIKTYAEDLNKTITFEEELEIHRVMQTEFNNSGHWYECPNGHPYTIGDCGRAWVKSVCPDCNAEIGGESHQLTAGNRERQNLAAP
ncbi:uncharacterized protein OCT59_008525 [Rhizophagus irregularis]|uniref:uncharacterized protein n=1 Tax=Rhizophagus irregularis TaxID=588596 RepID=UPI000CC7DD53|nr:hypothetical protein OCT59_008525 [Rhizophagus irregularis]GBC28104.1 P-loop containing nucleoside triphosphate hydrolase protein [Rhizophagus irregularis DAOM 181602=DAOM 197198]